MRSSSGRILTTHTGSMPRPKALLEMMRSQVQGAPIDPAFSGTVRAAVEDVVRRQVTAGVDVVSDGEMGKVAWNVYAKDRLTGLGATHIRRASSEEAEYPDLAEYLLPAARVTSVREFPACDGPIRYVGAVAVQRDVENLQHAAAVAGAEECFMTAASPGALCSIFGEGFYPSYEAFLTAVAEAMSEEYRTITNAGLVLQLDAPDLTIEATRKWQELSPEEFRRIIALHIEAINHATAGLPPSQLRLHVCWGNGARPHTKDTPLREIIDLLLTAKVGALSIEASNPRHEHEWHLFEDVRLPDGLILIPGTIDSTTNYVEHPELVAERIVRLAKLVGPENVIAGTDCGFGTGAGGGAVAPSVVWRKLQSLREGADIASRILWET